MPLGDDVLRLVKNPDDLALAANVRLRLNSLERLIALSDKIEPVSGDLTNITAGGAVFDSDGVKFYDKTIGTADEAATAKWIDQLTGGALGTIGGYRNAPGTDATFDIYANGNHQLASSFVNGTLELAALSKGINNWSTWLFMYASGDSTGTETVLDTFVGKTAAWSQPLIIYHNFTSRENLIVLNCSKATTGDPVGEEGMLYFNTFDNKIKMYADGAWRQLATW